MICPCECHQKPEIKSNCGKCGNTGTVLETKYNLEEIPYIMLDEKPIFTKNSKTLINSTKLKQYDKDGLRL